MRQILNLLNLKLVIESELIRIFLTKNIFNEGYTESWSREIFLIDSVLKTNPWTYKIKDPLNGKNWKFL